MNFNVTLPGLSCEFATLELQNVLGDKKKLRNTRTIHKFSLDGKWQGSATENVHHSIQHYYEGTDKDHYGNTRHAVELSAETFHTVIEDYEVLLVDFHAPWCSHCQHLAPIYEHAADLVHQKVKERVKFKGDRDRYSKHSVGLGTLDCTEKVNIPLCRENHIQAYPTILVFRKSESKTVGRTYGGYEVHESYHGVREAESIASFAMKVYEEVVEGDESLKYPPPGSGTNSEGDQRPESTVRTRGCRIEGYVMVQKVPTKIVIKPQSEHHVLNTSFISVDHKINHLSFGRRKPNAVRKLIQESMEGAYAEYTESPGKPIILAEGEEEIGFVSPSGLWVHEHYMKVVSTTHVPRYGRQTQAYEYTMNSNMHEPEDGVPEIVFSFDLSPLKVFVRERAKRFVDEFIKMMALIGGVFSCSIIFEGLFASMIYSVAKKLD